MPVADTASAPAVDSTLVVVEALRRTVGDIEGRPVVVGAERRSSVAVGLVDSIRQLTLCKSSRISRYPYPGR